MSAGASGVITEFLASVGFKADEKSLKASLAKVAAFGAAVQLAAVGIYAGLVKVASGEAEIARKAELLGTTSDKLQELQYVAEQSGVAIDAVTKSLDAMTKKNPRIKDAAKALELAGERMKGMADAQRKAYADNMGIDRSLVPVLISDTGRLTQEFKAMYAVAGYDARKAAQASKEFTGEVGKLSTMVGILAKSVALAFIGKIRHDIANLRKVIMENFDKIKRIFETAIKVVLRVASAISAFVYRVVSWIGALTSWYDKLDEGQQKVVLGIGLFIAAWKLLNAGFLATPLGMIVMGLAGIVALIDDYLTYMEGGESYFDWSPWVETIENARKALSNIVDTVVKFLTANAEVLKSLGKGLALVFALKKGVGIVQMLVGAFKALNLVIKMNPIGFLLSLLVMAAMLVIDNWDKVKAFFLKMWDAIKAKVKAVADFFIGIWQGIGIFFGGIWDGMKAKTAAVADFFVNIWRGVKNWFSGLWRGFTDLLPDFGAWASRAVDSIKNFFGRGIQFIKDKVKSLLSFLPDWVLEKLGLKEAEGDAPGGGGPGSPGGGNPEVDQAINDALLAIQSVQAATITPSPAQAANMTQNTKNNMELNAQTTINVQTSDPVTAANRVAERQSQVNADTVRHMKGSAK